MEVNDHGQARHVRIFARLFLRGHRNSFLFHLANCHPALASLPLVIERQMTT